MSTLDDFLAALKTTGVTRIVIELGGPDTDSNDERAEDLTEIAKRTRRTSTAPGPFVPRAPRTKRDGPDEF